MTCVFYHVVVVVKLVTVVLLWRWIDENEIERDNVHNKIEAIIEDIDNLTKKIKKDLEIE